MQKFQTLGNNWRQALCELQTMILDVTAGCLSIYDGWHKKLGDNFIGIDIRKGDFSYKMPKQWSEVKVIVRPTVKADMKNLPFKSGIFDAIIFDPPHIAAGLTGWIGAHYGSWTQSETIKAVRVANSEFARVLRPRGLLILKIMPRRFPLYEALLKNFVFFLPIQTIRREGAWRPKRNAALWAIATLKEINNPPTFPLHLCLVS